MSHSSRTTLGEGSDVSQAYVLFLTPPRPATAEERSTTESQESEITPLTPTHENLPLDGHRSRDDKVADVEVSYNGRMTRVGHGGNPQEHENRPAVHELSGEFLGEPFNLGCLGYLARVVTPKRRMSQSNYSQTLAQTSRVRLHTFNLGGSLMRIAFRWSLGRNNCKIAYYDRRNLPDIELVDNVPDQSESFRIQLTGWPDRPRDVYRPTHNLLPYDLDFKTYNQWRDSGLPEFAMQYADECEAFLIGRQRRITFDCYDLQSNSVNNWNEQSPERRRNAESSIPFGVMYFTVRPHPKHHPGKRVQSWVAFNQWPAAEMPSFSKKIPVHPSTYTHNSWSVTLLRIEFQWYDKRHNVHDVLFYNEYEEGLEVLVDSGSSTSDLPYRTIDGIHREVFGNADPVPQTDSRRQTYHIPPDFPVHQYRVQLVLKGERGRGNVVLHAPFKHFVCERNLRMWPDRIEDCPYQGVMFAAQSGMPFGVLGLNFFEIMFISFHKAFDGAHYLRMAPQEDVEMYELRYPSDSDSD
ncbi:hypothetical protein V8D89_002277 [Ganoderma adspersum]